MRKKNITKTILLIATLALMQITTNAQKPELVVQTGHASDVLSATFSPDGKVLASGSKDKTIKLWSVETGQQLKSLESHTDRIAAVAFSPDGKTLASGSWDKTIKLWNVETGQEIQSLTSVGFGFALSVAFSPDGKTLASGMSSYTINLWNIETGERLNSLEGHKRGVETVAFSPDGKTLASGSTDETIKLWSVETGQEIISLKGSLGAVYSVAFSPDGKILASQSSDRTIKLWSVEMRKQLRSLEGQGSPLSSITFSPDGKTLASGSRDNTIELWNAETGQQIKSLEGHTSFVRSVAFSPDGKTLASGSDDKTIKLWNVQTGQEVKSFKSHNYEVWSATFSPDGKTLASGSSDRTIKLWSVETGQQLKSLEGHKSLVHSVTFSPDGRLIASGSWDRTIKLWNVKTNQQLSSFGGLTYEFWSVAFSPDGKTIASGNSDGTFKLWSVETGQEIKSLKGSLGIVFSVAFSPDGKILASGSKDATIKLRSVETGQEIKSLVGHERFVFSVAFSPDGKTLASGSLDQTIKLWNIETGQEIKSLTGHIDEVRSVAFSPDGKMIASGSKDQTIKLWSVETGKQINSLEGHTGEVRSVAFSPDGKFLVSSNIDTTLKLWDVKSGGLLATLISIDKNDWVIVTPDGYFDGSPDGWKLLLWRLSPRLFDVVPVEAFFKEFYRPGLLQDIFNGVTIEPPTKDLSKIDIRQPSVKIAAIDEKPTDSTIESLKQTVKVKVEITDNISKGRRDDFPKSSDANDVRLFRNGSLVRIWRNNAFELTEKYGCKQFAATKENPKKAVCEMDVPIIAGKNEFTAYAFNHDDVKSNDDKASVEGKFAKRDGTLYVLAIGVNDYAPIGKSRLDLNFAVPDVVDIGNAIKQEQSKLAQDAKLKQYAKTEVITLKDETATRANILLALNRFSAIGAKTNLPENLCAKLSDKLCAELKIELAKIKPTEPEDALVIYYAGHGTSRGQRFYLLPHDFTGEGGQNSLAKQAVSDEELSDLLERVDAGRLLMTIDACQSGQALGAKTDGRAPMNSKGLAQLAYDKGMLILTATQSQEAALEAVRIGDKEIRHGLLSYALLEAMKSAAADKDTNKQLWEREWLDYAVGQVPLLQREAMRQRHAEINSDLPAAKKRAEIVYNGGDNSERQAGRPQRPNAARVLPARS